MQQKEIFAIQEKCNGLEAKENLLAHLISSSNGVKANSEPAF